MMIIRLSHDDDHNLDDESSNHKEKDTGQIE